MPLSGPQVHFTSGWCHRHLPIGIAWGIDILVYKPSPSLLQTGREWGVYRKYTVKFCVPNVCDEERCVAQDGHGSEPDYHSFSPRVARQSNVGNTDDDTRCWDDVTGRHLSSRAGQDPHSEIFEVQGCGLISGSMEASQMSGNSYEFTDVTPNQGQVQHVEETYGYGHLRANMGIEGQNST
ncbi:hypothetical protein TNCV_4585651 [Trichonephila clavipes]|nr:hypothetical protein TNCV_4585651 [Trichonephila clavipes]